MQHLCVEATHDAPGNLVSAANAHTGINSFAALGISWCSLNRPLSLRLAMYLWQRIIFYPKVMRKDYAVVLSINENSVDDRDQTFYENYVCDAAHNYTGYCNPELDKLIDEQSTEPDEKKRKQLVWNIERQLAEDDVQPIIFYGRFAMCWQPRVKGFTVMVNSLINGWRFEDVWLDE